VYYAGKIIELKITGTDIIEGEERNRVVGAWEVESHDREVDKKGPNS